MNSRAIPTYVKLESRVYCGTKPEQVTGKGSISALRFEGVPLLGAADIRAQRSVGLFGLLWLTPLMQEVSD